MGNHDSTCSDWAEALTALALGGLTGPEEGRVRDHLHACPDCRAAFQSIEAITSLVPELPRLEVDENLHQRIMAPIRVEEEAARLPLREKMKMTAGFVAFKLRYSSKARLLVYAAAAQILVLFSIYFFSDLIVQKTPSERRPVVMEQVIENQEFMPSEGEEEGGLIFPHEDGDQLTHHLNRSFDPPTVIFDPPEVAYDEAEYIDFLEKLDARIDRENRLDISRYRMYARLSVLCKDQMRSGRGGDRRTEYAVDRGLKWLRANQRDDGSWNPGGPFGGDERAKLGITALSVATFLSDGHSERSGRYAETVGNGLRYLLANQDRIGRFGWVEDEPGLSLFNQSTAVLVLAENFILCEGAHEAGLTKGIRRLIYMMPDPDSKEGQSSLDAFSDTWAAMALRTSVMTGIQVPTLADAAHGAEVRIAYMARSESAGPGGAVSASLPPICSASQEALTALFREEAPVTTPGPDELTLPSVNDPESLFAMIGDPDFREPSFLFFIGSALCSSGGDLWDAWNRQIKGILLEEQERSGLWPAGGDWPWIDGGDVYTTALHLLTLQVYYRYIKLEENCQ